jgi:hypothetical protein
MQGRECKLRFYSTVLFMWSPRARETQTIIERTARVRTSMHISDRVIDKSPYLMFPPSPHTHRNQPFHTRRPSRNVPATNVPVHERSQLMPKERWNRVFLRQCENVLFTFFFSHAPPLPDILAGQISPIQF